MRLWTLHPRYLDPAGLVALWRESLLAQAVLLGRTRGYTRHPQLARFQAQPDPAGAVAAYLREVLREAEARGYHFDPGRIGPAGAPAPIPATRGQLLLEWNHLRAKLARRDPERLQALAGIAEPEAHPLFRIVPGGPEAWERARPA